MLENEITVKTSMSLWGKQQFVKEFLEMEDQPPSPCQIVKKNQLNISVYCVNISISKTIIIFPALSLFYFYFHISFTVFELSYAIFSALFCAQVCLNEI